jgi:hypothetical protein
MRPFLIRYQVPVYWEQCFFIKIILKKNLHEVEYDKPAMGFHSFIHYAISHPPILFNKSIKSGIYS